ncbi:MAG: adenylate/guanylate cyclase domain-containing protein, partial [Gemmatimonadota bacterium]|nr:adenylate/guanylate cyclase domain-containing protein [Gemmatimonadota bacterium]
MSHSRSSVPSTAHVAHECQVCGTVLSGPGGAILRLVGIGRSGRNPNVCTRCNAHLESGHILEVTVLFADLSGFTAMTHELGLERTHEIVDAFLKLTKQEVVREDGNVDKFIGDAVMAVFNAPILRPDHALAAFRAATAIQQAMPQLSASQGRRLQATIGIAKGYARLGTPGGIDGRDHTFLGDVVNLAARLQSQARPDDVVVDASVYSDLTGHAEEVPEERLVLKGFPEPVACRRFGPSVMSVAPLRHRRLRAGRLGFGAVAFALLGAPCAATVALTPVAVWL